MASSIPTPRNGEYSLYFHVPFCTKKCGYCHFYVIPDHERFQILYMKGLKKEWQLRSSLLPKNGLQSIYFGGGTPSLIGPERIQEILCWTSADKDIEITIEVNPENVTLDLMRGFKSAGVNRISLGIQALDDALLKTLGRTHDAKAALKAVDSTWKAGFDNISIDLMYDVPGQSEIQWEQTLALALKLPLSHVSLYNLTIEPHTVFYKRKKELLSLLPTQEISLHLLERAIFKMEESGLARYEISAFAKQGCYSKHNTGYWMGRPFLGFGPSAFSYWDQCRFRNISNLNRYCHLVEEGKDPIDFHETLEPKEHQKEMLAIGLRLIQGVPIQPDWPASIHQGLQTLAAEGWVSMSVDHVLLTKRGLLFHDTVAEAIMTF